MCAIQSVAALNRRGKRSAAEVASKDTLLSVALAFLETGRKIAPNPTTQQMKSPLDRISVTRRSIHL